MTRTAHPAYDTETMLRFSGTIASCLGQPGSNFVALPRTALETVADLLSKFRLAEHYHLIVDTDADPRFSLVKSNRCSAARQYCPAAGSAVEGLSVGAFCARPAASVAFPSTTAFG